jgi:hypothetical protein
VNIGLKIRVSVVQFRPWAPYKPKRHKAFSVLEIPEIAERCAYIGRTIVGTGKPMTYFEERMAEIMDGHKRRAEEERARFVAAIPPPKKKPPERKGYVYFFRAGNTVKIGFTTNLRERSHSLRTSCPEHAFMAKFLKGGKSTERQFHERFAEYRLKGEWFDLRGRLAKYLEMHIKQIDFPVPIINEPVPEPGYL